MRAGKLIPAATAIAMVVGLAAPATADHEYIYTPTTTRFFHRNSATVCPGAPHLATTAGTGEPNCGYQAGAPFGELYHTGAPITSTIITYAGGTLQYLDPGRSVAGVIQINSTQTSNRMGAGWVQVDLTLRALMASGQEVTLGTSSETKLLDPTNSAETDFLFSMPLSAFASLDKQPVTRLTMLVDIRGWHILTGFHALNGSSWLDLPAYIRTVKPH